MLEWDERSEAPSLLRREAGDLDLILWDIVDERLGYFAFPDGGIVTNSIERIALNGSPFMMAGARHVHFGSEEHFEMFRIALEQFRNLLEQENLLRRVALLAPAWAVADELGARTPSSFGTDAASGNRLSHRYIEAIQSTIRPPILCPTVPTQADSNHRWGSAPFHYQQSVYSDLVSQLERLDREDE
jgi:hypothetical protein